MKISQSYLGIKVTLVYSKRVSVRNNLLHSVLSADTATDTETTF
jgi:hypothetical protein